MSIFSKFFGDPHEKYVAKLRPTVAQINAFESAFQKLSDEELRGKTAEFRAQLALSPQSDQHVGSGLVPDRPGMNPRTGGVAQGHALQNIDSPGSVNSSPYPHK